MLLTNFGSSKKINKSKDFEEKRTARTAGFVNIGKSNGSLLLIAQLDDVQENWAVGERIQRHGIAKAGLLVHRQVDAELLFASEQRRRAEGVGAALGFRALREKFRNLTFFENQQQHVTHERIIVGRSIHLNIRRKVFIKNFEFKTHFLRGGGT